MFEKVPSLGGSIRIVDFPGSSVLPTSERVVLNAREAGIVAGRLGFQESLPFKNF